MLRLGTTARLARLARLARIITVAGTRLAALSLGAALIACADQPYDPSAPAVDPSAPVVRITSPKLGAFAGNVHLLTVTGTATDDVGVTQVQVNGVTAALSSSGSWQVTIPVDAGTQLIHAVARDAQGNLGKESRAVVAGPVRSIGAAVPHAITAAMSAQTFDAISRGVTGFLRTGDLLGVIAPHNPVLDVGGGPDCNYVQASITRMTVGAATAITIVPGPAGIALDAELDHVALGMHLRYAVLCGDGERDIAVTANHVKVRGVLAIGIASGAFDIALTESDVQLTGVDIDLGDLPPDVIGWLDLDTALASVISWVAEQFAAPALGAALASLADTRTVDVLGTPVDVKVAPSRIAIDAAGALIDLDTALRAHGDTASPGYVFVANEQPAMSAETGFGLAVADDAANQLLGSLWAAHGLDRGFDLTTGSYGDVGKLYDRVELSAKVPPFVSAGDGALRLTIGDLIATFKNGDTVATEIAVSAEVELKIATAPDGRPRLDVGAPTTYVDVLDDRVGGANVLSNAQFEVIASFALGRVIAVGSGALGALPLPAFGGVAVRDLAITEQTGYLVVRGSVE
jgi:hypothetical protein